MNGADEAQKIWKALKPMIDVEIADKTRSSARMKSMVVSTAYNATTLTIGVKEAFGDEIQLPVYGNLDAAALTVGTAVWVLMPYSSMSNAVVFMKGAADGSGGGGTVSSVCDVQPAADGNVELTGADIALSAQDSRSVTAGLADAVAYTAQTPTAAAQGIARENTGVGALLWEGSLGISGTATLDAGFVGYRMFGIAFSSGVLCVCSFDATTTSTALISFNQVTTRHITLLITLELTSAGVLSMQSASSLRHEYSGSHGAVNTTTTQTITAVYGIA